jgi:uncharacterized protein (TIGR02246 family)
MKKMLLLLILTVILGTLWAADPVADTREIRATMDRQVQAWNNGNIEGFMAGYWKSDSFTFQSGNKRLIGWDNLMAMYKKNYAGEKMGKLKFTDIQIKTLANDVYLILGRWQVTTKDSQKEGLFTLIFKRIGKDWKIIHDHSS